MPLDTAWSYGTDLPFMKRLISYWSTQFDWRAQEDIINQFPQFTVKIGDIDLHYLHVPAKTGEGRPLLLSHGWPGSIFEFIDARPVAGRHQLLLADWNDRLVLRALS